MTSFCSGVTVRYVRTGGIKRQMRRGNWNDLGPHLSKVVIALSSVCLMVMIQQKSLPMWPTLSISTGWVWTLQHHQWCFAVGKACLALASWMFASIEPTVSILNTVRNSRKQRHVNLGTGMTTWEWRTTMISQVLSKVKASIQHWCVHGSLFSWSLRTGVAKIHRTGLVFQKSIFIHFPLCLTHRILGASE